MRRLYHYTLSAPSRAVRFALAEKGLDVELRPEEPWQRRPAFLRLNPAGEVPVLVDEKSTGTKRGQQAIPLGEEGDPPAPKLEDETPKDDPNTKGPDEPLAICDARTIIDYLDDVYGDAPLAGSSPAARAEARRLWAWFDVKFQTEVTTLLVTEKVMKRQMRQGQPDAKAIRAGLHNVGFHLEYVGWLAERRNWLAGDFFSIADIAAAAHLSCIDYLDAVPWDKSEAARTWYARIKSRKAFRAILSDHVPGLPPPRHYADPDF